MIGVLLMAYGGPGNLDEVEAYILDVRNFRPTSAEIIEEMRSRYRQIGGSSPILALTQAQARGLETALVDAGLSVQVFVGMRHWHPHIADTLKEMGESGVDRAVGLVMAPHYSRMSVGAYFAKVEAAASGIEFRGIPSWHLLPEYLDAVVDLVERALLLFPSESRDGIPLIASAHSLPDRIVAEGDPYRDQLLETVSALGERLPGRPIRFAFQSAAMTPDPWLGPDVGEVMRELVAEGHQELLVAPIGFTSEHVEVLYDIDVEYQELARELDVHLERIEMMNDHPLMMRGLAGIVREELVAAGWL
jgi:ferrochelatase